MSTYDTTDQNSIDCNDDDEHVTRKEVNTLIHLQKLQIVYLRKRLTTLEKRVGVELPARTDKMASMKAELLEQLDEVADDE